MAKNIQGNKSTNNQNVNSMNQVNETDKTDLSTLVNSPNLSSVENQSFKLEFNDSVTTNSPCLNQSNLTAMNNDLSFNNSFNNQLTGDLENNPHLINRPQGCNMTTNQTTNSTSLTTLSSHSSNDAISITNSNSQVNFACSPQGNFFGANQSEVDQMNFDAFANHSTAGQLNKSNNYKGAKETCATCAQQIMDRYLLKVNGHSYHEGKCLLCCCCGSILNNVCYQKNSKLYCKHDYLRKCDACSDVILPTELVMKIYTDCEAVFHLKCFACHSCKLPLKTGDHFSFNGGLLFCKQHLQSELASKADHLVLTSTINSPLTNLCQQSINQMPPLLSINNPLNSAQSLHLQPRTTLCNLSNSLQNNLPNNLSAPELQTNSNLNSLMICSSNNLSLSTMNQSPNQLKLNSELNKEVNKESSIRNRTDGRRGPKRPRTILTTAQRRAFKNSFEISQKPCRKVREQLAKETGLSVRIVQVWFQNSRASKKKERRRLEGKLLHQSPNNGINSQNELIKNMQHNALSMNSHLQTSTSFSNEESRSQMSDEDYEHIRFVNSPNDSSYYSQSSYSKSINGDLEDENIGEEENCLNSLMSGDKNSKLMCNQKNANNSSFGYTNSSNVFPIQTFSTNSENSTPPICAVAQAIASSNDILTTNCSTPLSNSTNSSTANGLEFTQTSANVSNISMTPIDKLYSMQSSYFSLASENCENCLTTN